MCVCVYVSKDEAYKSKSEQDSRRHNAALDTQSFPGTVGRLNPSRFEI